MGKKKNAYRSKSIPSSLAKVGYVFDTNTYSLSSNIQLPPKPMVEILDKIIQYKILEIE